MTLYHETSPDTFMAWNGELIGEGDDAVRHPLNIEQIWPADELAAIGLYAPVVAPIPEGKQVVSSVVQRIDGVVTRVDTYEDAPVERRLVEKTLILDRITDAQLDAALAAMTPRQKERWRAPGHPEVYADDPETVALLIAIGADPEIVLAPG